MKNTTILDSLKEIDDQEEEDLNLVSAAKVLAPAAAIFGFLNLLDD